MKQKCKDCCHSPAFRRTKSGKLLLKRGWFCQKRVAGQTKDLFVSPNDGGTCIHFKAIES